MNITFADQQLTLLPEKALYWPREQTVFVADTHFGKDAVFRRRGLAVPEGQSNNNLERLQAVVERTQAQQLIVLGDFIHAAPQSHEPFFVEFDAWRQQHANLHIVIVMGNHDRALERLPSHWNIVLHDDMLVEPFALVHEPPKSNILNKHSADYYLAGHIHPCYRVALSQSGRQTMRLPVFWRRSHDQLQGIILPSFGEFTGGYTIKPSPADSCYAVHDGLLAKVH